MHVRGSHLGKVILFIIIPIFILLAGCTQPNKLDSSNIVEADLTNNQTEKYIIEPVTYKYQNEYQDTLIVYPRITDSNFEKVNELIKTEALKLREFDENYRDDEVYEDEIGINYISFDLKYEIKYLNENHISVVYTGLFNPKRAAHPTNLFYAITINLETAEILSLADFIKSYEYLEDSIVADEYEVLYGGLKEFNSDEIVKFIHDGFESVPINENKDHFYISKNRDVCIIIDLPHGGGDYSIINLKS